MLTTHAFSYGLLVLCHIVTLCLIFLQVSCSEIYLAGSESDVPPTGTGFRQSMPLCYKMSVQEVSSLSLPISLLTLINLN